jgi:hypothetical protein
VSGEFRLADTSIMTIGSAVRRRAAVATGALIAGALVAIGITVLIAAHGEGTKSGEIPPLIGSWTITRIDVGSAQQVTVPAGHASIDWYPPSETDIPGPDGQPTHVRADAELDIVDVSCTYTRDGNTLTLTEALAPLVVPVNPSALDLAISHAVDHGFATDKSNTATLASTSGGGVSLTLGDVVCHLITSQ